MLINCVCVFSDVRKLGRDFEGVKTDEIINLCIDLGVFANSVLPFQQRWSMEKLVEYFVSNIQTCLIWVYILKWAHSP